ncbi:MAG: MBL fold metallo-hydrolase, partial [Eubacteriales bacterium]
FLVNTYLCHDEARKETVIIDPGGSYRKIKDVVDEYGLVPKAVLLTHGHFDHIGALEQVRADFDVTVYIHVDDADMLTDSKKNLSAYLFSKQIVCSPTDEMLQDGQKLALYDMNFEVLSTPGHSPGSVVYLCKGLTFTGDTLFYRSIGRTDFYGCDAAAMNASLAKLKQAIPKEDQLFPGHGQETTMAEELKNNMYLNQ